ncbi:MAG: HepT-like ribonuclease domain-containing protein [Acidobacteriota bacterium]
MWGGGRSRNTWKDIKGVRVILAHKYADIELRVIWEAATRELPNILSQIETLMTPFEKE